MPITRVKTEAIGVAVAEAFSGEVTLNFSFHSLPSRSIALAQTHGFIEALLSDIDLPEAGMSSEPIAGNLVITRQFEGCDASFDLKIQFFDGRAVETWLDDSGLVEDQNLVTVAIGDVDWNFNEESFEAAAAEARALAVLNANHAADDYSDVIGSGDPRLVKIKELGISHEIHAEQNCPATLGEFLSTGPHHTFTVAIEATFTLLT